MRSKKREILRSFRKKLLYLAGSTFVLLLLLVFFVQKYDTSGTIDYSTYRTLVQSHMVDQARVGEKFIYLHSGPNVFKIPKDAIDLKELYQSVPIKTEANLDWLVDVGMLAILAFLVGYMIYSLRRQQREPIPIRHEIQIAPAQTPEEFKENIQPQTSDVTFEDVAGIDEVKEELEEIIDFLQEPQKYIDFGVRMPRGVLLVGPPGVGKTLIAKAVAGEAGVPFFYQSGSAFVQIYVGMGAKRVRELFQKAKEMAPAIVFIDEIDAVGKARGGMRNDEREATLNQLLTEMDGFEDSTGVVVIGATNKIEVLDEALLRPGRFDRRIFVSLPGKEDRKKILHIYLRRIPHDVDLEYLAQMTVGFSGAALASLVNEAALHALRNGKKVVKLEDFERVKDKVLLGKRKLLSYDEKEKRIQSLYQGAKALAAYWYGVDFEKITLVGGSLSKVDREILSKNDYLAKIKALMAGYVAQKMVYEEIFSNSAEDLKRAKVLAEEMVLHLGMGDRLMADMQDVAQILESVQGELKEFFKSHQKLLQAITHHILTHESITKADIKRIVDEIF